jgi:hypothetical protein
MCDVVGPLARSAGQRVNALLCELFYLMLCRNAIGKTGTEERSRGRRPLRRRGYSVRRIPSIDWRKATRAMLAPTMTTITISTARRSVPPAATSAASCAA